MSKYVIIIMVIYSGFANAENKLTISGHIRDARTGEELIGVSVYQPESRMGVSSNVYGFYSLTLPAGEHKLHYGIIGYKPIEIKIKLDRNLRRDIELEPEPLEMQQTIVTAESADEDIKKPEMSSIKLNPARIKTVPILFGEQDLLKTIQLMPGVQAASEGNSGFYVRGGGADQNLILLDEAIVYNASHLAGFFSVFNSDAIKEASLLKGAGSAEYGGRLSSVMDLKMKEGNSRDFAATGGLGLIFSRFTVERPIKKDVSSFIISGRRSYWDLFLKLSDNDALRKSRLYFYDLNAKTNYRLGENDRLFLSGYFGKDVLGYHGEFGVDWGNSTATVRWNHIFNDKLFSNSTFVFSKYHYQVGLTNGDELVQIRSSIWDLGLKEDFQYFIDGRNLVKLGWQSIYHTFLPGEIHASNMSSVNELKIKKKYAWENALYLNHEYQASSRLSLDYGLRYSAFEVLGPGVTYTFDSDGVATDSVYYGRARPIKYYGGLEPRLTMNYLLDDQSSVKLSYARNRQYLHLLSTSTTTTPFDIWHPSTKYVKPGVADQIAAGYFRNCDGNKYETSLELYYKKLQNQIDYKNGADVFFNERVEADLVFGRARSYGLELFAEKKSGHLTGWLSYTLARTEKKFAAINSGSWFPARQDRTHDIAIVGMYKLGSKWTFSFDWIYSTGNAVTFPVGKYVIDGHIVNLYTDRNAGRMPDYHRLDISFTRQGKHSSWNFSLYNAYGRRNAYAINFRQSESDSLKTEAVRIALFTFVPSITYNFSF